MRAGPKSLRRSPPVFSLQGFKMQTDLDAQVYAQNLRSRLKKSEARLASWTKWPWHRKKVPRLLREMAHTNVVLGIELFNLDNVEASRAAFRKAISLRLRGEDLRPTKGPTYFDIQVISAGFCSGYCEDSEDLAGRMFESFDLSGEGLSGGRAVSGARHGTAALLGWMSKGSPSKIEELASVSRDADSTLEQFRLWGICAYAGTLGDVRALRDGIDQLASFAERQSRSGDFAYTEDRFVYLPGMGIVAVAIRDSLPVAIPQFAQFPQALLHPCH